MELSAFAEAVLKDIRREEAKVKEPKYPLTLAQQKRMVFLLRKYMATVSHRRLRRQTWDLTKCDDETRALFREIKADF
jgi:hypothetical protein